MAGNTTERYSSNLSFHLLTRTVELDFGNVYDREQYPTLLACTADDQTGVSGTPILGALSPPVPARGSGCEHMDTSNYILLESYVDSGAARSVCPRTHGRQFGVVASEGSQRQQGFLMATGRKVLNRGTRNIIGLNDNGNQTSMDYVVADVSVALDSVSQICDHGCTFVFGKRVDMY